MTEYSCSQYESLLNYQAIIRKLEEKIKLHNTLLGNLTVGISHISERLQKLEEKDRLRAIGVVDE